MIKKLLRIIFLYIFISLLPTNVEALCNNSEIASLKELASNINVSYSYKIQENYAVFNITLDNIFDEIYVLDENKNRYDYNIYNNGVLNFINYAQGTNYKFDVYANGGMCDGTYLTTIYATTPKYNRYYNLAVCDNAREYNLCGRWVTHNLSYNEFVNNVKKYIENRDKIEIITDDKNISTISYILNFIEMYYIYIIIVIVVTILIIKYIKYKRDTFGF